MSEYILETKSVSGTTFKTLFEVLSDILGTDINLIFGKDGLTVIEEANEKEAVLAHLSLTKDAFETYNCESDVIIPIIPRNIFKILKISTVNDVVSFLVKRSDPTLFIIRFESNERLFESEIRLLNKIPEKKVLKPLEFSTEITMASVEFQNICKNLNSLGVFSNNVIEIQKVGSNLIFKHKADFSDQKIFYDFGTVEEGRNFNGNPMEVIQGEFNLKLLLLFTKATKMSSHIKISLKNDSPILLEYPIGDVGKLCFLMSQVN